jgi:hypothetical protein
MTIQSKEQAKAKAAALQRFLKSQGLTLNHRKALDALAIMDGLPNWNTMAARLPEKTSMAALSATKPTRTSSLERVMGRLTARFIGPAWAASLEKDLREPQGMSKDVFLALQALRQQCESDVALGHDAVEGFDALLAEIDRLAGASGWALHPDYGCVSGEEFVRLEAEAAAASAHAQTVSDAGSTEAEAASAGEDSHWDAELVRIAYGSLELEVEADSLEEALGLAEARASNTYIPGDNFGWGIGSMTRNGVSVELPKWAHVDAEAPIDYCYVPRVQGRARYRLRVTREGVGFADWSAVLPTADVETAASRAMDDSGSLEASEKSSNYLIEVLGVEALKKN